VKTTITARISIDRTAWRRVQDLAARQAQALPDVLGQLLDEASAEKELPYEPPSLLRLWLRRHPDTVVERD
jgi:macrodomain Ter protein organizer (MatP/YcbG family)